MFWFLVYYESFTFVEEINMGHLLQVTIFFLYGIILGFLFVELVRCFTSSGQTPNILLFLYLILIVILIFRLRRKLNG